MANKSGFSTVVTSDEDLLTIEKKIKKHRRKIVRIVIAVILCALLAAVCVNFYYALRTYDSYEEKNIIEQGNKSAAHFAEFGEYVVEYSNDGIVCMTPSGNLIWNQAFEMASPKIDVCKNYVCIYDKGGKDIYIIDSIGIIKQIETSMLISSVKVAAQGTVAVMMEEKDNFYVKLFDKTGKELTSGKFFSEKGAIPSDIALSYDARKLAVSLVDITEGKVNTQIAFYNFGSVGQNEINNNVGTFTYEDTLIAEIDYIGENTMIAKCDDSVKIFEGSQRPELAREITFDQTIESLVNSDKYIAVVYNNQGEDVSHHILIYNLSGKIVAEGDTSLPYTEVRFLSNNELLVKDGRSCELFTIHSIQKFKYTFDVPLYSVMYEGGNTDYIIFKEGSMEEVRLK